MLEYERNQATACKQQHSEWIAFVSVYKLKLRRERGKKTNQIMEKCRQIKPMYGVEIRDEGGGDDKTVQQVMK